MNRTLFSRGIGRRKLGIASVLSGAALVAASSLVAPQVSAEPTACLSANPTDWPSSAKPYFMILFDTSGSMTAAAPSGAPVTDSCGFGNTRISHAKCALRKMFFAFGGQVNFGLAAFLRGTATGCTASCGDSGGGNGPGNGTCFWSGFSGGCGLEPTSLPLSADRRSAEILVPMQLDNFYSPPLQDSNIPELLKWVDNDCSQHPSRPLSYELWAEGGTPLNGILRDAYRYLSDQWIRPTTGTPTFDSPIALSGERGCRTINTILVTDGSESCDLEAGAANDAAADLLTGFDRGGIHWSVKTHVIDFGSLSPVNDALAAAGGTGTAKTATSETQLSLALSNIIASAIKPETCDNVDNNCNGCTDEGFAHYCNQAQTCCTWSTPAQRATCLSTYQSTITTMNPSGDLTKLPCTTPLQANDPTTWLCYNPKESCDNVDNNCDPGPEFDGTPVSTIDEGVNKCGNPAHCPKVETCNGQDDDCDGQVDEAPVCVMPCIPSPEICDGCDNDCDGIADNGAPSAACGLPTPANCAGTLTCKAAQPVALPGACVASGGGFNPCTNSPQAEVCDSLDNNCDGKIDEGVAPTDCVPVGTPANLNYGANSQCKKGKQPCNGTCQGFVGPSAEICDGIDNDCDGTVDESPFGVGTPCGNNQLPCMTGLTACVNGALVCQGGVQPSAEVCDGKDNDCDGSIDETPLADAPAAGMNGCWTEPGNCCTFGNLTWCPPTGGTCNGTGTLTAPCNTGKLVCQGTQKWVCSNPKAPSPEVCDGLDNNCNGMLDDGSLPQVGTACGSDAGECAKGTLICTAGVLDCANDVGPVSEICDGKDNDCDGVNDNGIPSGGPCSPAYDTTLYPGDRTALPCTPGEFLCNGAAGVECLGGVVPQPELCDGIDNDCDGTVDESGPGPDGVDGSMNPQPMPAGSIGQACGVETGECKQGTYTCQNGGFVCTGETTPVLETCDCADNDCDGVSDNPNNGIPLCSTGKECVKGSNGTCQCSSACNPGKEYPCPPGQQCQQVTESTTGENLGFYCVSEPCADCELKTVKDAAGNILCAPADTQADANCHKPPVCVCKGQVGCKDPCDGVSCGAGEVCTQYGPKAGQCVVDNCYNVPCVGCNKVCNLGSCVDNPCQPDSCPADQICKPSSDFTTFTCVSSCANVDCPSGQVCQGGTCVAGCSPACASDQYCDLAQTPPTCVQNQCAGPCASGGCCNPVTGACGNCPCEGIVCRDGEVCLNECPPGVTCTPGECVEPMGMGGSGGAGGSGGSGGSAGAGGSAGPGSGSGGSAGTGDFGAWGLATGGGGCACSAAGDSRSSAGWLALLGLSLTFLRRRRSARNVEVA
ncbi:MopE-related protein [Polyangium sp. 6x1]|uniref:MopE-related protein n=1 Tax=Polyangium sp. 6x1 TaxID=3042689 RepID=UPI00248283BD|nr:MopE-related protein [Polyangium sp. 6x1]MDI1449452.1 MopE-related protein [Polyangium sp. 6x1]